MSESRNVPRFDDVVNEITLERVRYTVRQMVTKAQLQDMRLDTLPDFVGRGLLYQLSVGLAARKADAVLEVPADWWQAVCARWAPAWWLKRHPVVMKTWRAWEMLPRVPLPEKYLENSYFVFRSEVR